ncbi:glycosyltransferase family 2 protein [Mesorhizobium xinjiangense]|uniref:glycosyltransferase family 2 protein n=1 Tax=Mesorhizobium xinjiangense TaxID=2678685 RepID=UPI0018DE33FE|nr:glycosyltransferase family 2 protein [Mesorhizobium xinjiangense]
MKADRITDKADRRCMAVIPCLDEAAHIGKLLDRLAPSAQRLDMTIVVVDGGSTDATCEIVRSIAANDGRVVLLENPKRIQSAAVNLAVETYGAGFDVFIRIDAHGDYPDDYCDRLVEDAERTGADSVVVAMNTEGRSLFQKATALAQNSKLGNGGSSHRAGARGHWTDHGHHALMRNAPFKAVGGYDETFTHNEDAELDHRLTTAGYRIWMTDRTVMTYFPRATASGLFRQYFGYGKGRARNLIKHRTWPKVRQALPLAIMPLVGGTSLALIHWWALLPAAAWAGLCVGYGVILGIGQRNPHASLAGVPAMIMHLAWSAGFWTQLVVRRKRRKISP